jgi:hypothetical protein
MSEKYIEYLCDLIADSHDPARQTILLKELDVALTKATLQTQNRVTHFVQEILKRESPAA